MPCRAASSASLASLRPTRMGSTCTRSPVLSRTPPLLADREDGPHQVLTVTHPAGRAVHDDADALLSHEGLLGETVKVGQEVGAGIRSRTMGSPPFTAGRTSRDRPEH